MTFFSSNPNKISFSDYQFAIGKAISHPHKGMLLGKNQVTIGTKKNLDLTEAVQQMGDSFKKLTQKEKQIQTPILNERLTYIKNAIKATGSDVDLSTTIQNIEKQFKGLIHKEFSLKHLTPFQHEMIENIEKSLPADSSLNVKPLKNGDLLFEMNDLHEASRFFRLHLKKSENTLVLSEDGNSVFVKNIFNHSSAAKKIINFLNEEKLPEDERIRSLSPLKEMIESEEIDNDLQFFSYEWGIEYQTPDDEDVQNIPPEKLLEYAANGWEITGEQFLDAAERLKLELPKSEKDQGPVLTTLNELYMKASAQFIAQDEIDEAFKARAKAAQQTVPTPLSPFYNMDENIGLGQKNQKSDHFAAHFNDLDTGILKGGSIKAFNRNINSIPMTQMEFKLSWFARHELQENLIKIQENFSTFKENLPSELKGKVHISEVEDTFLTKGNHASFGEGAGYTPKNAKAIQVEFEGIGAVVIGNSPEYGCLINNMKIFVKGEQEAGKALMQVHQMLAMLGVGPLLNEKRASDEERLKIAFLFRSYFPRAAVLMERTKEFYELSIDDLMDKIEGAVPEMTKILDNYDANPSVTQKIESFPGKNVLTIPDISNQMRKKNAFGLMSGVGGQQNAKEAALIMGLILTNGHISFQDRAQAGLPIAGVSSEDDLKDGGGDHVFTRLINKNIANKFNVNSFIFSGAFQVLYDLDAVNVGAFAYNEDQFGVKNPASETYELYENRENLIDFTSNLDDSPNNEVMIKNMIPPHLIRGIVCQSEEAKKILIEHLEDKKIVVDGKIHGKLIDEFIHVSFTFKKQMWDQ